MNFTGERFVPGLTSERIEADHFQRYRFAASFVRERRVLDIACGAGYGSSLLGGAGAAHVDGVDVSDEAIEHARSRYAASTVAFAPGDICAFRTANRYDVITCFETIEHVADFEGALGNLHALLQPRGLLLISSPNRLVTSPHAKTIHDKPHNPHHVREFVLPELRDVLEEHGFTIEGTYGQRQRRVFRRPLLRKIQGRIFKPDERANPAVTPLGNRAPRYFVLVARKTAA